MSAIFEFQKNESHTMVIKYCMQDMKVCDEIFFLFIFLLEFKTKY